MSSEGADLKGAEVIGVGARGPTFLLAASVGAVSAGAVAIGALAIGRLAIRRGHIGKLTIEELEVGRLTIIDRIDGPGPSS